MIVLPSVRISKAAVQTWEKNHKKAVKKKKKALVKKIYFIKKKNSPLFCLLTATDQSLFSFFSL